ncbi:MAG: SpoIVB peptidase [Peptococcaceae bacterium]|jgi:stage IV sporulation protein B|nr:SpoIVB peptidase [Peptococcaceae bacterium]MDH7525329.1 SpoIVB peptidase [Peptococcaceae bacterium]
MSPKKRQILGLFFTFLLILGFLAPQARNYFSFQEEQMLSVGDTLDLFLNLPPLILKSINVHVQGGVKLLDLEGSLLKERSYRLGAETSPVLVKPGKIELQLKLFNVIPLKKISVSVVPNISLVPGGHSIGVLLRTDGVMVVGFSPVLNEYNIPVFPARDADIAIGDIIVEINGTKVVSDDQVKEIVASWKPSDQGMIFKVRRGNEYYERVVYPQYCRDTRSYRIGLFIRDNAGGVGTLTFYEPVSMKFGALGHMITDSETNQALRIKEGKILAASVQEIQKAKRGFPGEKVGIFLENSDLGNIEKNDNCGIYGTIYQALENPLYSQPLPVAYSNQVRTGKAEVLTVLDGQEIKKFGLEIERIMYGRQDGKNMIVRITDKNLLDRTGGIVQGMSGSPIIQNGKIVGAITHVFVNDPGWGYGVFIENMLYEAGVLRREKTLGLKNPGFLFYNVKKRKYYYILCYNLLY